MAMTVVGAPEVVATEAHPPSVTITVHITLTGDELPPAASRLLSDLEALAAGQAALAVQSAAARPPIQRAGAPRNLRLVESAAEAPRDDAVDLKVRRIGPAGGAKLSLCTGSRLVLRDGVPVPLTRREYDLFLFLCEHPRRVFSRAQLLRQVWGYDMVGTERTVDVHVRRLRVKLADAAGVIATVRGVGYRLDDDAAVQVEVRED